MGFFDRIENVIKSYVNDLGNGSGEGARYRSTGDSDLDEAMAEIDGLLGGDAPRRAGGGSAGGAGAGGSTAGAAAGAYSSDDSGSASWEARFRAASGGGGSAGSSGSRSSSAAGSRVRTAEEEDALRKAYTELGVPYGSSLEVCKAAYKKLLIMHHPDKHAGHPGDMKKATEKTARVNAAFDCISKFSN
jgi:hypothetical protein